MTLPAGGDPLRRPGGRSEVGSGMARRHRSRSARFADAVDIACLIGGIDPAAPADGFFSEAHHRYLSETYPDLAARIAGKRIIFVD